VKLHSFRVVEDSYSKTQTFDAVCSFCDLREVWVPSKQMIYISPEGRIYKFHERPACVDFPPNTVRSEP